MRQFAILNVYKRVNGRALMPALSHSNVIWCTGIVISHRYACVCVPRARNHELHIFTLSTSLKVLVRFALCHPVLCRKRFTAWIRNTKYGKHKQWPADCISLIDNFSKDILPYRLCQSSFWPSFNDDMQWGQWKDLKRFNCHKISTITIPSDDACGHCYANSISLVLFRFSASFPHQIPISFAFSLILFLFVPLNPLVRWYIFDRNLRDKFHLHSCEFIWQVSELEKMIVWMAFIFI